MCFEMPSTPPLIWAVLTAGPDDSRTSSRSPPGARQGCRLHLPNKQTSSGSEILSVSHCVPLLQKHAPLVQEFLHVPADSSLRVQALLPAWNVLPPAPPTAFPLLPLVQCFSGLTALVNHLGFCNTQILTQQIWGGSRLCVSDQFPGDAHAGPSLTSCTWASVSPPVQSSFRLNLQCWRAN